MRKKNQRKAAKSERPATDPTPAAPPRLAAAVVAAAAQDVRRSGVFKKVASPPGTQEKLEAQEGQEKVRGDWQLEGWTLVD